MWNYRDDKEGLRQYIDALLTGQRSESAATESTGAVSDTELFHMDSPTDQVIRVSIRRLVDYLLLRDRFDIPLWGKVHFVTDGHNIVPREFIASIGQILGEEGKFLDPNKTWKHVSEKDLEAMGLKTADVTSSMNRKRFSNTPTATIDHAFADTEDGGAPPAPPREIEIRRDVFEHYINMLTQVVPEGEDPYFTRRIINMSGVILWCGTSYELAGPWRVWTRNTAELLAIGVNL